MSFAYQERHPPSQLVAMVTKTNSSFDHIDDQPRYADSWVNKHIRTNLDNITSQETYKGEEEVAVDMVKVFPLPIHVLLHSLI